MKRILGSALLVLGVALTHVSCSDGGLTGAILGPALEGAESADLSGQRNMFQGRLGSGMTFTFPAVKDQTYVIKIAMADNDDEVTFDVWGDDGSHCHSMSRRNNEDYDYKHVLENQHVLVIVRPREPWNTDIDVTSLTFEGTGPYDQDKVHVNFIVAGKFTGLGIHNDLATAADQAAFTDAVMAKVNQIFQQTGIAVSYEGFYYTGAQVQAVDSSLVAPDDQTICSAGETSSSTGFSLVNTDGLDKWGELGFAENDASFNRAHGIDVFIVHHFDEDGTVGLSPRPGILLGKGRNTALGAAAFLRQGGQLIPRSVDDIGLVTAHEIGHFLGLLHTTEFKPDGIHPTEAVDDGLSDTPECDVLTDVNGDGCVGVGDGCQDEANVMFYQSASQTTLTSGQAAVMQAMLSVQEH